MGKKENFLKNKEIKYYFNFIMIKLNYFQKKREKKAHFKELRK